MLNKFENHTFISCSDSEAAAAAAAVRKYSAYGTVERQTGQADDDHWIHSYIEFYRSSFTNGQRNATVDGEEAKRRRKKADFLFCVVTQTLTEEKAK